MQALTGGIGRYFSQYSPTFSSSTFLRPFHGNNSNHPSLRVYANSSQSMEKFCYRGCPFQVLRAMYRMKRVGRKPAKLLVSRVKKRNRRFVCLSSSVELLEQSESGSPILDGVIDKLNYAYHRLERTDLFL